MDKKYISIEKIFDTVAFDVESENAADMVPRFAQYAAGEKGRCFYWFISADDRKIHISKQVPAIHADQAGHFKNAQNLVVDKNNLDIVLDIAERLTESNDFATETLRIYQKIEEETHERFNVRVSGGMCKKEKQKYAEGIMEITDLNDDYFAMHSRINKHMHDIGNQMMMVLAAANNIQRISQDREIRKYAAFLKDTAYSCKYMLSLIKAEKSTGTRKLFNTHQVITTLLDSFRCETDITFVKEMNAHNPRLYADKVLITNVIYNILINAIQATEHKGHIKVSTYNKKKNTYSDYQCQNWLFIDIEDDGMGFDDQIKEKIFNSSFTTKNSGSGVGLYTARTTLEQHNGGIYAKSGQKCGAVFTMFLPSHVE